jgi:hypothetical protein
MALQSAELDYLSPWAREEKAPDPYAMPAHQLQAAHQLPSVMLIRAIKAWARSVGRRDEEIFGLGADPNPPWPRSQTTDYRARLEEIAAAHLETRKAS